MHQPHGRAHERGQQQQSRLAQQGKGLRGRLHRRRQAAEGGRGVADAVVGDGGAHPRGHGPRAAPAQQLGLLARDAAGAGEAWPKPEGGEGCARLRHVGDKPVDQQWTRLGASAQRPAHRLMERRGQRLGNGGAHDEAAKRRRRPALPPRG